MQQPYMLKIYFLNATSFKTTFIAKQSIRVCNIYIYIYKHKYFIFTYTIQFII